MRHVIKLSKGKTVFLIMFTIIFCVCFNILFTQLKIKNDIIKEYQNDCCLYESIRFKNICKDVFVKKYENDIKEECKIIPSDAIEFFGIFLFSSSWILISWIIILI
jgi:hypothetical protein